MDLIGQITEDLICLCVGSDCSVVLSYVGSDVILVDLKARIRLCSNGCCFVLPERSR